MADSKGSPEQSPRRTRAERRLSQAVSRLHKEASEEEQVVLDGLQRRQSDLETKNQELRRVRMELQRSRKKYLDLFDSIPVGYFVLNKLASISEVNHTGAQMLGLPKHKFLKSKFSEFVAPESWPLYSRYLAEMRNNSSPQVFETRLQKQDGSKFYALLHCSPIQNARGELFRVRIAVVDITEKKAVEQALAGAKNDFEMKVSERTADLKQACKDLQQNQQQLQGLFQNMAEGAVLLDTNGKVLTVNPAAAKILRMDGAQIIGTYYDSLLWKGKVVLADGTVLDRDELILLLSRVLSREIPIFNQEARLEFPGGTAFWLRGSITPLINLDNQVTGAVVTFIDVTAEKSLQEQFARRLLETQEEERKRIARELHDDTAQSLSVISLELDSLISGTAALPEAAVARLQSLKAAADRALEDIRRYSHKLHPELLHHLGLVAALEQLVNETAERAKLNIQLNIQGEERKLDEEIALVLFRIAQESLNNIRKHAEASKADVTLEFFPDKLRLSIIDNGKGFMLGKESAAALERGSLGLLSMRERASIIGADFRIQSIASQGTKVVVEL